MSLSFLTFLTAGLCSLLLATTMAEAEGRGRLFERLDRNDDGLVTQGEVQEARGLWFARVDANGDGYLTVEEMTAMRRHGSGEGKAARIERRFAKMDQDGDARISQAEFTAMSGHWIDRADSDGDGAVSREEWRVAAERRKGKGPDATSQ